MTRRRQFLNETETLEIERREIAVRSAAMAIAERFAGPALRRLIRDLKQAEIAADLVRALAKCARKKATEIPTGMPAPDRAIWNCAGGRKWR